MLNLKGIENPKGIEKLKTEKNRTCKKITNEEMGRLETVREKL